VFDVPVYSRAWRATNVLAPLPANSRLSKRFKRSSIPQQECDSLGEQERYFGVAMYFIAGASRMTAARGIGIEVTTTRSDESEAGA